MADNLALKAKSIQKLLASRLKIQTYQFRVVIYKVHSHYTQALTSDIVEL